MRSSMSIMDSKDLNVIGKPLTRDSSNIKMLGDFLGPQNTFQRDPPLWSPDKKRGLKRMAKCASRVWSPPPPRHIGPDFIEKSYQSHFLGSLCEILMQASILQLQPLVVALLTVSTQQPTFIISSHGLIHFLFELFRGGPILYSCCSGMRNSQRNRSESFSQSALIVHLDP